MTSAGTCLLAECDRERYCRELCNMHYSRWRRTGRLKPTRRLTYDEVAQRAKAEAVVLLAAKRWLTKDATLEEVGHLVEVSEEEIRAAAKRIRGDDKFEAPFAVRRRRNRSAPKGKKWCARCEQYKWLDQFSRHRGSPDGRQGWCRSCFRDHYREQKAAS